MPSPMDAVHPPLHKDIYSHIADVLTRAQHVLVLTHKKPDGDTLGAAAAFAKYLKNQGTRLTLFCLDGPGSDLDFLPLRDQIPTDPRKLSIELFDVIAGFDFSTLSHTGIEALLAHRAQGSTLINFDHHFSNMRFGDINLVDETAPSTTAVLHAYFKFVGAKIDADMATALLTGLVTDTGSFTNAATNIEAFTIASELLNSGAKIQRILQSTFHNKSLGALKVWGIAFSRLVRDSRSGLAVTILTREDLALCGVDTAAADGIANFLNILGDVDAVLVLRDDDSGFIRGSLRTTKELDVSVLARYFGGGGHKKAAGFTLQGILKRTNDTWRVV